MTIKILAIVLLTYSRIKYRLMITSISYSLLLSKSPVPIILICPYTKNKSGTPSSLSFTSDGLFALARFSSASSYLPVIHGYDMLYAHRV